MGVGKGKLKAKSTEMSNEAVGEAGGNVAVRLNMQMAESKESSVVIVYKYSKRDEKHITLPKSLCFRRLDVRSTVTSDVLCPQSTTESTKSTCTVNATHNNSTTEIRYLLTNER